MQNYRRLIVWRKAHTVALAVHQLTERWPTKSNLSLIGQLRRAGLSVPANIAEGCAKSSDRDFARFVQIAIGSTVELEYHLEFAADVGPAAEVRLGCASGLHCRGPSHAGRARETVENQSSIRLNAVG